MATTNDSVVTREQQEQIAAFWRRRLEVLRTERLVSDHAPGILSEFTLPEAIGYGPDRIRPDERLSAWDLYYTLQGVVEDRERNLITGLTPATINEEHARERSRERGNDDDDMPFGMITSVMLDPESEELTREIRRVRGLVAKMK